MNHKPPNSASDVDGAFFSFKGSSLHHRYSHMRQAQRQRVACWITFTVRLLLQRGQIMACLAFSCASSQPCSWVSDDTPAPRPQLPTKTLAETPEGNVVCATDRDSSRCFRSERRLHLGKLGIFASCGQPRIGQPLAADSVDERIQPLKRMALHVPFVQAERELVNIAGKVLRADFVINAIDPAFQECPHAFDAVGTGRPTGVLTSGMVHGLMAEEQSVKVIKHNGIVGVELRTKFHIVMNLAVDSGQTALGDRLGECASAPFAHPENGSFAHRPTSGVELLVLMLV